MKRPAAIYAHYAEDKTFSDCDSQIINCLAERFKKVVVVSTSMKLPIERVFPKNVQVISRQNFGYDFLSYKIGLATLGTINKYSGVLFLNSSIYLTSKELFEKTLQETIEASSKFGAVGLTKSDQIKRHLQSYWMMLSTEVLMNPQIRGFWQHVSPVDSKWEIITSYEIGLSQALENASIPFRAIYNPNQLMCRLQNIVLNARIKIDACAHSAVESRSGNARPRVRGRLLGVLKPNLTHLRAVEISKNYGFIKKEVLFRNPLGIRLEKSLTGLSENASENFVKTPFAAPTVRFGNFSKPDGRIAVCLHVFHRESLLEIARYLRDIPGEFDVFASTSRESLLEAITQEILPYCRALEISIVKNKGRDVEPFLRLIQSRKIENYQIALKLHTKLSTHSANGVIWRDNILQGLLGSPALISSVVSAMTNFRHIGIFAPRQFYVSNSKYDGKNKRFLNRLSSRLGYKISGKPFIAGTMFWFRPKAFSKLATHPELVDWFEPETGQLDGTFAHALERGVNQIVVDAGFIGSCYEEPSRQISVEDASRNSIPTF